MTPDEPQTRMTDADECAECDGTLMCACARKFLARSRSVEPPVIARDATTALSEPPREMVERARAVIAPYFATDGEEEDLRIAEAVEGLLGDMAAEFTSVRTQTIEECARVADAFRDGNPNAWDSVATTAKRVAAAIRALLSKETPSA